MLVLSAFLTLPVSPAYVLYFCLLPGMNHFSISFYKGEMQENPGTVSIDLLLGQRGKEKLWELIRNKVLKTFWWGSVNFGGGGQIYLNPDLRRKCASCCPPSSVDFRCQGNTLIVTGSTAETRKQGGEGVWGSAVTNRKCPADYHWTYFLFEKKKWKHCLFTIIIMTELDY